MLGMKNESLAGIVYGFFSTFLLAVVPPLLMLAMPAGGLFLAGVPFWVAGVVIVRSVTFLRAGNGSAALGVCLAAFAGFLVFDHSVLKPGRVLVAECSKDAVELRQPSNSSPFLVVFDDVGRDVAHQFSRSSVIYTLLTEMHVVEINRDAAGSIETTWTLKAGEEAPCTEPTGRRAFLENTRRKISYCLTKSDATDQSTDSSSSITFRGHYGAEEHAKNDCHAIEIVERYAGEETVLGRFKSSDQGYSLYPMPSWATVVSRDIWLPVIIRAVFGKEYGLNL